MIKNQISTSPPRLSASLISEPQDEDNFEYFDDEYEDAENSYRNEYDSQEEDENSPTVYYNLPTKRPDPKQEKLKAESLIRRNQQIQEKKEQAKHHPIEPLNFLQTSSSSDKDHFSFKKVNKLPKPLTQARLVFEIAGKNLLIILLQDGRTVKILNFKLVKVTKAQREVKCMSYCKKLGRIIVGGANELLQLWSPKTFEVQAESLPRKNCMTILSVGYAAKSNVIIAKTSDKIYIYNTGLGFVTLFVIPCCASSGYSDNADFFSLSKNLLMTVCHYVAEKGLILFNLKTGTRVNCEKTVFIPKTTSIEMTEKLLRRYFPAWECLRVNLLE